MRLRDAGRLRLTDPVGEHVPGTPFADVTIAQLLTHTAGLSAELPGPWWERSLGPDRAGLHEAMRTGTVLDRPGRYVHYSNLGYAVLGQVIEALAGRDWFEVVHDEILMPLGNGARRSALVDPPGHGPLGCLHRRRHRRGHLHGHAR